MAEFDGYDDLDHMARWLYDNQSQKGSQPYIAMLNAYKMAEAQGQQSLTPDVIQQVPDEAMRTGMYKRWATGEEQKAEDVANQSYLGRTGRNLDAAVRMLAKGVPGGSWLDELNAWTASVLPTWAGGVPYEQAVAQQRARDERIYKDNPVAAPGLNLIGAGATIPLTTLRAGALPNIALDTAIGGVTGAGEGEGSLADRAGSAGMGAAVSGGVSAATRGIGSVVGRYSRVTPEVEQAVDTLGLRNDTPFYVRAADPRVQAAGRQTAQELPNSGVARGWNSAVEGYGRAGEGVVQGVTGAPSATAPNVVGPRIASGMQQAAQGYSDDIARLAEETSGRMPAGVRYDMPQTRGMTGTIIGERTAAGNLNPTRGLEDTMNLVTQPGGATWQGVSRHATDLGEALGQPSLVPRDLQGADLSRTYRAVRADQPAMVRQALGPQAEATYRTNLETQSQLAGIRDSIVRAIQNKTPEQLVNMIYNAATTKGVGTNLDQLGMIWRSLSPAQREQAGAGILALMQNKGSGVPNAVANLIEQLPVQTRAMLFPPGSALGNQVDALSTLGQRLGAIDRMQHTGSARTLGRSMVTAVPTVGALGAAGYWANQAGMLPEAMALGTMGALGRYGLGRTLKPYVLQRGLSPDIAELAQAIAGAGSRGAGQYATGP